MKTKSGKGHLKYVFLLNLCFIVLWFIAPAAQAEVIWCNPKNSGDEDGKTKKTGYHTLWRAMSAMAPNDTLTIANGDWRRNDRMCITARKMPPDGANGKYTKIQAETDWEVKLPHIRIETDTLHGFIEFRGIVFDNRFVKNGTSHYVYNMNHTKFIRCGFLAHGLKGNRHCMGFGTPDYKDRSKNAYNLMEECIAWGSGRYMLISWNGEKTVFRRCLVRRDFNDGPQIFNFRAYACSTTVFQNCISIDSDRVEHYKKPLNVESGGFWLGDPYGAKNNALNGCISIKDIQLPFYIGGSGKKDHTEIRDCVALDVPVPGVATLSAFILKSGTSVTASNVLGMNAPAKQQDGFYGKKAGTLTVSDSILRNVGNIGLRVNRSENINHYQAGKCARVKPGKGLAKLKAMFSCWGPGATDYDPLQNGLRYPVRIEPESPLSKAGKGEGRCGPEILKKIGVSGTLYGEPGWNKVTNENLWPFPNETKIRELMGETVDGVSGNYGFCRKGRSLSHYIWGYLGNTVPPFNVTAVPGDGTMTLKWDPPAEAAIGTITGYRVYKLVGKTKTPAGGTITGNKNCTKTISGLQNGQAYTFAVTAIDREKGESGLSYKVRAIPEKRDKSQAVEKSVLNTAQPQTDNKTSREKSKTFSNRFGMVFVPVQPGTFAMGLANEPETVLCEVTIKQPFYLQKTEVTQEQWKSVMGNNPSFFKECGKGCPVEQVSWNDVQGFIEKLNRLESSGKYRLPTEAEWEYACRAGTGSPFSFGNCLSSDQANYNGNYPYMSCNKAVYPEKPVSTEVFSPNAWGLSGMHGNVWEWCRDWIGETDAEHLIDPKGPPSGTLKVIRGGGWNSYAKACRSGNRSGVKPGDRFANLGFRLILEP